jgi:hypothetical protein
MGEAHILEHESPAKAEAAEDEHVPPVCTSERHGRRLPTSPDVPDGGEGQRRRGALHEHDDPDRQPFE